MTMFILIRLILGVLGFAVRWKAVFNKYQPEKTINNMNIYKIKRMNKSGAITQLTIGIDCSCMVFFKITRENSLDRFFKRIGFSEELQTGDQKFDQDMYIACDHYGFLKTLSQNPQIRKLISALVLTPNQELSLDGKILWLKMRGNNDSDYIYDLLRELSTELNKIFFMTASRLNDSFFWKAIFLESILYTMVGYGIGGLYDFILTDAFHLDQTLVVKKSILCIIILNCVFLGLTFILLKGSSRAHRVFIESLIIIIFFIPFSGVVLTVDLNWNLDQSQAKIITSSILISS